jgi:glycosyltransferase involved in cell wall biosynthesis
MASGKPCIAFNAGGFRETIVHGHTGILIDPPYVENLADAIRHFNSADFKQEDCLARAQLFSEEVHIAKMKRLVARISA